MVGNFFFTLPFIPGLTLWFVLILKSSHKILCDSPKRIKKASLHTMNALNKSSELWHTSVNRKARPVVEGEHDKSWNDHGVNVSKTQKFWVCSNSIENQNDRRRKIGQNWYWAHCLDLDLNDQKIICNCRCISGMLGTYSLPKMKKWKWNCKSQFEIILFIHFYPLFKNKHLDGVRGTLWINYNWLFSTTSNEINWHPK